MAGNKYLGIVNNRMSEVVSTQTSAGAGDANKIVALNSAGYIDITLLPTGVGPDVKTMIASEALSAGNLVNVWNDAGTVKARKTDATTSGKESDGFVLASYSADDTASVYFEGLITGLSGLTLGARYYLSTTAGNITATAPSSAGNVLQYVGKAVSATELSFEPSDGIILG